MGGQEEDTKNYYAILNCSPDSSLDDLKKSYHKLALRYHPDKNDVHHSPELFQSIEEAWRVLGNEESKKDYDAQLKQLNLEDMSILLFSRIKVDELKVCPDDEDVLTYTCRCGGDYKVHKSDLDEKNCTVQVPCQECTLVIEINT